MLRNSWSQRLDKDVIGLVHEAYKLLDSSLAVPGSRNSTLESVATHSLTDRQRHRLYHALLVMSNISGCKALTSYRGFQKDVVKMWEPNNLQRHWRRFRILHTNFMCIVHIIHTDIFMKYSHTVSTSKCEGSATASLTGWISNGRERFCNIQCSKMATAVGWW